MSDQIKALKRAANDAVQGMGVPTCKTCVHISGNRCMATGRPLTSSRMYDDECGNQARYWTPKPPSFFKRLGDAIIDRITP